MIVRALVIAFAIWSMFIEDLFLPDISVWGATGITVGCSTDTGAIFSAGGFGEGFTDISSSFGGMDELIRFWKKSSSSGSNFDFLVDRLPSLRVLSVFFAFFFGAFSLCSVRQISMWTARDCPIDFLCILCQVTLDENLR